MNNNKKGLNELTNLLKWQIEMGADAMTEEKNNFFSNKETNLKVKNLDENYIAEITQKNKSDYKQNKKNINENYSKIIKDCTNLEMLKEEMQNFDQVFEIESKLLCLVLLGFQILVSK